MKRAKFKPARSFRGGSEFELGSARSHTIGRLAWLGLAILASVWGMELLKCRGVSGNLRV